MSHYVRRKNNSRRQRGRPAESQKILKFVELGNSWYFQDESAWSYESGGSAPLDLDLISLSQSGDEKED